VAGRLASYLVNCHRNCQLNPTEKSEFRLQVSDAPCILAGKREKKMRLAIAIIAALLAAPPCAIAADTVQPAVPLDRPPATYPDSAGSAEGTVKLSFKIGADGHVHDAAVIDSNPRGMFDSAAIDAVSHWTYHPRTVNGRPAEQADNAILLRFKPDVPAPERAIRYAPAPYYPEAAYLAKAEGNVVIDFDVTADGDTTNVRVTEATTPGLFDQTAIAMVKAARFEPLNDPEAPPEHLRRTVEFSMAKARLQGRPDKIKAPQYPSKAADMGYQGLCDLQFTVRKDGTVADPHIEMCYPKGFFEKTSLDAVKHWTFLPVQGANGPEDAPVYYRFNYRLAGEIQAGRRSLKPHQWIKLKYTLTATGTAKDIQVVATSEPGLSTSDAVKQLQDTQLTAITKDGQPVEIPGRIIRIVGD
jgi:TonB family protein